MAISRYVTIAYQGVYCILAIYYSIMQLEQYYANEDASVISFRSFNQRPDDKYPDFSICFENGRFDNTILEFREQGWNSEVGGWKPKYTNDIFSDVLKGRPGMTRYANLTNQSLKKIMNMDPELYSLDLADILEEYSLKTNKKVVSFKRPNSEWKDRMHLGPYS